jgi:hypothetical protein
MTNVREGDFDPLPPATYLVEITECAEKETKKNKDPMISVTMEIISGLQKNRKIWDNIIFPTEDSPAKGILFRTKAFLRAINEPCEGVVLYDTGNWIGKKVQVKTSQRSYNNKIQTDILAYISVVDTIPNPSAENTRWDEEESPAL